VLEEVAPAAATTVPDLLGRRSQVSRTALDVDHASISYEELWRKSTTIAHALANADVRHGDRVVLLAANSLDWVAWMFASLLVGAIVVPLPTRWRRRELGHALADCDPSLIVVENEVSGNPLGDMILELVRSSGSVIADGRVSGAASLRVLVGINQGTFQGEFASTARFVAEFGASAGVNPPVRAAKAQDAALIQYTSGTTAFPKGAVLPHQGLVSVAEATAERMGMSSTSRFFSPQPFFYVGGLPAGLLVGIAAGATTFSQHSFDPERALEIIEQQQCTHHAGVAPMYAMEYGHASFNKPRVASLTVMRNSGRPKELWRHQEMMGGRPTNTYGLTEACSNVAMADHRDPIEWAIETCGRPLPGVSVRIVNDAGESQPPGSPGEIHVRGNLLTGYWPLGKAIDRGVSDDGWLRTGDIGMLDELGRLHFLGRIKHLIRVGGHNVSPLEVEEVLAQHPAVTQAVVFGAPDERLGEVVVAVLQLVAGVAVSDEDLVRFLKTQIASYKVPSQFERVEALPLLAGFKIDRKALSDRFGSNRVVP
jgi:acyl-CoA synthetase (AMP-forming)/AMP-acid ligase II